MRRVVRRDQRKTYVSVRNAQEGRATPSAGEEPELRSPLRRDPLGQAALYEQRKTYTVVY
jgi:hypothetical protein